MLPAKLKQFNVFNDGQSYLGVAKQIELPKLKMAAEEYRGAGMLAPVDHDLGLEKLEMTATYGGMAMALDSGPRAIGMACGRNPIPIIVPCHRVLGAGGKEGGFSGGRGLPTKRQLLALEGVVLL